MATSEQNSNFFGKIVSIFSSKEKPLEEKKLKPHAYYYGAGPSNIVAYSISYNGEKNLGEMGPIRAYQLDYEALRLRSWQSYLESDVAQLIINKYVVAVIGGGLKLQANPHMRVLEQEGIEFDTETFNDSIESYFQ